MSAHRFATSFLSAALLLGAGMAPAGAQVVPEVLDARWLAYVGCWEPVGVEADAGLLCFRPSGQGVEMQNVSAGQVTSTEVLVADGEPRPVSAEGCEGTESVQFSSDGRRAFTRSDFVCAGDVQRSGTGVMSIASASEWVDVRSLAMGEEPVAWVQRYRLVGPDRLAEEGIADPAAGLEAAVRTTRRAAATGLRVDDVEEAVALVDAQAVEAWVAAHGDEFRLDADELVRLADAGVPGNVIDVMVAVSYPERFVVEPGQVPGARTAAADAGDAYPRYRGYRSFMWDPFYSRYHRFGYSGFGYSPFGYFGSGFGYYGYRPTRIVVVPREPERGGRFVKGQGYTGGSSSAGSTGRFARPRSGAGGGTARAAPSRAPSSQPASSAKPRRAKRRGGGSL